jgi:hypothetical protein
MTPPFHEMSRRRESLKLPHKTIFSHLEKGGSVIVVDKKT